MVETGMAETDLAETDLAERDSAHRFRVALHDTDSAGVLFFGHLFRHAHDAYEEAMMRIGWPIDRLIRDGELGLPLVHAEADFLHRLRHGDSVRVSLALQALARKRFVLDYRFWRGGELAATASTVHVAIDPRTGRSRPLPAELIEALGRLADGSVG
jgi:1,4-dihydroxy-2-naphthoyl-CoA hydrolase